MPVESTSKCRPVALRRYATCTSRLRWRRHNVLKSGTAHVSPDIVSKDCTKPVVYRKARPKRFLMVRQNWMAASENCGLRPRLPLAAANHDMFLSSQTLREPRALSAALYCFHLVMR